jgi:hypothetical protein
MRAEVKLCKTCSANGKKKNTMYMVFFRFNERKISYKFWEVEAVLSIEVTALKNLPFS